jgi:hypothetical protein
MSINRRNVLAATTSVAAVPLLLGTIRPKAAWAMTNPQTFAIAWNAFNTRNWTGQSDSLDTCLANRVKLFKVNNGGSVVGHKNKIIRYLKDNVATDSEQFQPQYGTNSPHWTDDGLVVSGIAGWTDNDSGSPQQNPISYFFRFNDQNLITVMFGSKD